MEDRFAQEKGQFWSGANAAPPDYENPTLGYARHETLAAEAVASLVQSSMNGSVIDCAASSLSMPC